MEYFLLVFTIGVFYLIKIQITTEQFHKANDIVHSKANWKRLSEECFGNPYRQALLSFHPFKWTFKQMFPELTGL